MKAEPPTLDSLPRADCISGVEIHDPAPQQDAFGVGGVPNYISLGAGVQSSTMALMAANGELPKVEAAIFADTGDEPKEVMAWLDRLEKLLPFPVHRVKSHLGKLSENLFKGDHSQIPAFMVGTIGKRQCTREWKIRPVRRKLRELSGGRPLKQWIGISLDEVWRMKPSGVKYVENVFPLLDKRMRRTDCEAWLARRGFGAVPKSACIYCPYRSDRQWLKSRTRGGAEWRKIVAIDRALNKRGEFLHPTCEPIDRVKLSDSDRGQADMFNNECEGMCGV